MQELAKDRTFKVTLKPQQPGMRPLQMFIGAVLEGWKAAAFWLPLCNAMDAKRAAPVTVLASDAGTNLERSYLVPNR